LALSSALTRLCSQRLGGSPIPQDCDAESLLEKATLLSTDMSSIEKGHRVRFDPTYPGAPDPTDGSSVVRLVLTCRAWDGDAPIGTVFTVLLPGRWPQVSVAPADSPIPRGTD
jgi:hypothetical protein